MVNTQHQGTLGEAACGFKLISSCLAAVGCTVYSCFLFLELGQTANQEGFCVWPFSSPASLEATAEGEERELSMVTDVSLESLLGRAPSQKECPAVCK